MEWVLSTTFNAGKDTINQHLKDKTDDIFSILEQLAKAKLNMTDGQIESIRDHSKPMFDFITGESPWALVSIRGVTYFSKISFTKCELLSGAP